MSPCCAPSFPPCRAGSDLSDRAFLRDLEYRKLHHVIARLNQMPAAGHGGGQSEKGGGAPRLQQQREIRHACRHDSYPHI